MSRQSDAALTRHEAEDLLYEEARRLDEGLLDEWLELFTSDAVYWLPNMVEDPVHEPSVVYDDRARMEERVYRLTRTPAYAQMPPSRTVRIVSNVQVGPGENEGEAVVRCTAVVYELRVGGAGQVGLGDQRAFPASCQYQLRREGQRWKIAQKKVLLLDREQPLYNLTFVV